TTPNMTSPTDNTNIQQLQRKYNTSIFKMQRKRKKALIEETLSSEDIQEINANTINNIENKKKDIRMSVEICKENIFHKDDKVEIKQALNQEKIDDLHLAVLKSLDKGKISHGAISSIRQRLNKQMQNLVPLSLTNVEEASVASELIEDQPHITDPDIVNNVVESAEKGEQHFIIDILNFIVPEYIKKRLLIPNNTTIKLHISGDGRNIHRDLGLMAFSYSALEKKNYIQVCRYFQNTLKDGGHDRSRKSAILEILEHENRQLFYWQANVSSYIKKATQYRLE
ncbi:5749_t:CDS:2, partial [Racocetra fulgida]